MKTDEKSVAYAFIANGVHFYHSDNDYFILNQLTCSECGESWHMNLTECFLCGTINPYLYKCLDCNNFISITNARGRCNSCSSNNLVLICPNDDCISNNDIEFAEIINSKGGVFNKESGMLIAQQYCLNCGSDIHQYKTYKVLVRTIDTLATTIKLEQLNIPKSFPSNNSFIILKLKSNDKAVKYSLLKSMDLSENIKINHIKSNFNEIVVELFPTNILQQLLK